MSTYTHGHAESVLRSHRSRTAANSAAYLLPHLAPASGCSTSGPGPGTITADLAVLVAPGEVVGARGRTRRPRRSPGPSSTGGRHDVTASGRRPRTAVTLDEEFDVVHAHQVLQHVADPVPALREMAARDPARRPRRRPRLRLRPVRVVAPAARSWTAGSSCTTTPRAPTAESPTPGGSSSPGHTPPGLPRWTRLVADLVLRDARGRAPGGATCGPTGSPRLRPRPAARRRGPRHDATSSRPSRPPGGRGPPIPTAGSPSTTARSSIACRDHAA